MPLMLVALSKPMPVPLVTAVPMASLGPVVVVAVFVPVPVPVPLLRQLRPRLCGHTHMRTLTHAQTNRAQTLCAFLTGLSTLECTCRV